jgi:hypothetical protein
MLSQRAWSNFYIKSRQDDVVQEGQGEVSSMFENGAGDQAETLQMMIAWEHEVRSRIVLSSASHFT